MDFMRGRDQKVVILISILKINGHHLHYQFVVMVINTREMSIIFN